MKITIFNGSPKGDKGSTYAMAEEFAKGAQDAGAEVEHILLVKKDIKHCLGCFTCWIRTPGKCVIKDDMTDLLTRMPTSDIVVFATPLYVDNVTGLMKNFMDRLIPLLDPHFERDASGECRHQLRFAKPPKIVVISNCGFPEINHFQVLQLLFRRIARNMNSEVIAEIYRPGGALIAEHPFILKPFVYGYKKAVRQAGKEVAENGKISTETIERLAKPIIPDDMYINGANKSFDKAIAKAKQ